MTTGRTERAGDTDVPVQRRLWLPAPIAFLLTVPGLVFGLGHLEAPDPLLALIFGLAIVGAAFLLSWAAEAAQVDLSAGLAIAILALIAVLPEYAVDFVFTWEGGQAFARYGEACAPPGGDGESACALALANMTGANRILVGVGWSLVVLLAAFRVRNVSRRKKRANPDAPQGEGVAAEVSLPRGEAVPVAFLLLASVYGLTLPLKPSVTLIDFVLLVGIFVLYTVRVAKAPKGEPHLVGPSAWLGGLPALRRRVGYVLFFVVSGAIIFVVAEPFAEALVASGEDIGVSEFFLVQWVAPLASEAPELLIAALFAWRLLTSDALATLISSKVNQWTLLVGTLPLVFSISAGSLAGLPIDSVQRLELLLTASQSLFAVALLLRLRMSVAGALALLGLFVGQFVLSIAIPGDVALIVLSVAYLTLAVLLLLRGRTLVGPLLRDGFRTSFAKLEAADRRAGRTAE